MGNFLYYRPMAMRKDGIQTRKRKPKKSGNKTSEESPKKEGHSSPGIEGERPQILTYSYSFTTFEGY